jgi:hypothetical protein
MVSKMNDIDWLVGQTNEYRLAEDDIGEIVEDFSDVGKLGHVFPAVDELDMIDIGDGVVHGPTYVN